MSVSDIIYNHIKTLIVTGKFKNHDLLPFEEEYASVYGINRIHIRKAFARLEAESFIVRTKRKGTIILYRPYRFIQIENLLALDEYAKENKLKLIADTGCLNKVKWQNQLHHKKVIQVKLNQSEFAIYEWLYPSYFLDTSLSFEQTQQLLKQASMTTINYSIRKPKNVEIQQLRLEEDEPVFEFVIDYTINQAHIRNTIITSSLRTILMFEGKSNG